MFNEILWSASCCVSCLHTLHPRSSISSRGWDPAFMYLYCICYIARHYPLNAACQSHGGSRRTGSGTRESSFLRSLRLISVTSLRRSCCSVIIQPPKQDTKGRACASPSHFLFISHSLPLAELIGCSDTRYGFLSRQLTHER